MVCLATFQSRVSLRATSKTQPWFIRIRWQPVLKASPESWDTSHPSWSKTNDLKLPTCSRATLSNTILQGVIPTCHTDFLDVDTVVGANIRCCNSAVISFRLSRSKDVNMFQCLPPSCSTWETLCVSAERLNSCDQMTPYPLLFETSV